MLDIKFVRENPELVQEKSTAKGYAVDVALVLQLDNEYRALLTEVEKLRRERNALADSLRTSRPSPEQIAAGRDLKQQLTELEEKLNAAEVAFLTEFKKVPNMPSDDVPFGKSEDENVVVKTVGAIPTFAFEVKSHWQIGEARGWIDKERAAKVSGARFSYLKGPLVQLQYAMMMFGMDQLANPTIIEKLVKDNNLSVSTKPFIPVLPPAMIRTDVYDATGRLNGTEVTYKIEDEDLWLNASAEHSLAPMYLGETLEEQELPIRYVGFTTAFRREAGTYGKDEEGILRMHQFDKLEMESFCVGETSMDEHLLMVAIEEYLMAQLEIPYRVLLKCTADIGKPNARGVDIEAWIPSQHKYRETHSADLITDYQTRRMNTRVKRTNGICELVHTNDATAFSQRPLIAIIENNQQADGTVVIPKVLRSYMGGRQVM